MCAVPILEAVIWYAEFANLAVGLRARLPKLRFIIQIGARSDEAANCVDYEGLIAQSERLPRASYREDDIFMLYTGGTTGLPKGVIYRHGDLAQALLFGSSEEHTSELQSLMRTSYAVFC